MKKTYVTAGTWSMKPAEKGITVFAWDEQEGTLTQLHHYDSHVAAGAQYYDEKRKILYVADECENHAGERGGGGFIRAYALNSADGSLRFLNERCTLMTAPAYVWVEPRGEYCLVACHTKRSFVTKVVHDSKGNWSSSVLFDDAGVVLIRLKEDGSLGEVCDVVLHTGLSESAWQVHAHPHSVVGDANGEIFFVCDKGLDRIFSYQINREKGKLLPMAQREMPVVTAPRYSVFHPTLPVWYENNETDERIYAFRYETESGYLKQVSEVELLTNTPGTMQSDLRIHPSGKWLYAGIRTPDCIAILDVDEGTGALTLRKLVSHIDGSPRGFAISPDGRFLLVACAESGLISVYRIDENGELEHTGKRYPLDSAANLCFCE